MGSYSLYFPATLYVGLVHHAAHTTEVVSVRMQVDDGDYRSFTYLLIDEVLPGFGDLKKQRTASVVRRSGPML